MTGDERLAKVAEVLAGHQLNGQSECDCDGQWRPDDYQARHQAQALALLLDEFRAEDETRALREGQTEARRAIGLWATRFKAFMEHSRERERVIDRNTTPTLSSEFWRGYESALDDLIRTVTSDTPTDPTIRAALAAAEPDAGAR